MESAKNSVKDFLSRSGKHDTSVHEEMNPAVTSETVKPHRHENVTTAVDKEVHQDHYHTTVQPVHDKQTLPEKHHHNLAGVEHRKYEHGNDREVSQRLEAEKAKFKDTTTTHETRHTNQVQPTVAGEHVHHHVHENVQPVVHREVVQPEVVHTTVPVHEKHHNAAQHHSTTALPAVTMAEFEKQGGGLHGRETRHDHFQGEPRNMHAHAPTNVGEPTEGFRQTGHTHNHGTTGTTGSSGLTGNTSTTGTTGTTGTSRTTGTTGTSGLTGTTGTTGTTTGTTGTTSGMTGTTGRHHGGIDPTNTTGNHSRIDSTDMGRTDTNTTKKPSLLDRLNPTKDTDGDGKKGVMS